jgi:hypothetical protein
MIIKTRTSSMNLTNNDVEQLRAAFQICRVAGIDAVVVTDNQIRGVTPSTKMAVISPASFSFDSTIKLGIGRIGEFEKRLNIFAGAVEGEGKLNDANEVSVITLGAGRSKVQFRCTSERLIKYPKANDDDVVATITAKKSEVQQVSRAVKTLGAEQLTLAIGRDGAVKFECSSPTNEAFATEFDTKAEFESDPQGIVHIYEGDRFATVLDAAARDAEEVTMVLGELGSLTISIKGHTVVALPEANQENDDE